LERRAVERGAGGLAPHRADDLGGELRLAGHERGHVRQVAATDADRLTAVAARGLLADGADIQSVEHRALALPGGGAQRLGIGGEGAPLQGASMRRTVDTHGVALDVAAAVPVTVTVAAAVTVAEIAGGDEVPVVERSPVPPGPAVDAGVEAEAQAEV